VQEYADRRDRGAKDTTELTAEELKAIRAGALDEQEQKVLGLETKAGILRGDQGLGATALWQRL
jgi:hypothetical protein